MTFLVTLLFVCNVIINGNTILNDIDIIGTAHLDAHPSHDIIRYTIPNIRVNGAVGGTFEAKPSILNNDLDTVTVYWSNITYTGYYDYIALFNATDNTGVSYNSPPIKYKYICPTYNGCNKAPSKGNISFKLLNRRTNYIFAYVSPSGSYQEILGISEQVTFSNLYQPMRAHVGVIPTSSDFYDSTPSMVIVWIQKAVNNPVIKYGLSKNRLEMIYYATNFTEINADDYCDQNDGEMAGTAGYFKMDMIITGYLTGLEADTEYFYSVGDEMYGYTDVYSFKTAPLNGKYTKRDDTIKMILFGDMGDLTVDGSLHHSWDNNNKGELGSINTTQTIIDYYLNGESDYSDIISHCGDVSYSVGYESEWDTFLFQISNIATKIPYMTGIGNHEYSYSGMWIPDNVYYEAYSPGDSGGECGVSYNALFPFANSNNIQSRNNNYHPNTVQPYYYYDYGVVRTIMLSTEHDYSYNSPQYKWFENILQNTDRTSFPWIIVSGHRPMYSNDDWVGDTSVAQVMRQSLEPLFKTYKISFGFWGHQHSYGRTFPVYDSKIENNGDAPIHFIVGAAGYKLSSGTVGDMNYLKYSSNHVYGFLHVTFINNTHSYGKFINVYNNTILDDFYIINYYH